jgi:hypothetical protein
MHNEAGQGRAICVKRVGIRTTKCPVVSDSHESDPHEGMAGTVHSQVHTAS